MDPNGVVTILAGQKALADKRAGAIYDAVGGKANYEQIRDWAKANLNANEQQAFLSTVLNGSIDAAKLAVQGLASRFTSANGSTNNTPLAGGTGGTGGAQGFATRTELAAAVNDPKYRTDPGYRRSVEARIAASDYSKI
jgi:hypothetical protein